MTRPLLIVRKHGPNCMPRFRLLRIGRSKAAAVSARVAGTIGGVGFNTTRGRILCLGKHIKPEGSVALAICQPLACRGRWMYGTESSGFSGEGADVVEAKGG